MVDHASSIAAGATAVIDSIDLSTLLEKGGAVEWRVVAIVSGENTRAWTLLCAVHAQSDGSGGYNYFVAAAPTTVATNAYTGAPAANVDAAFAVAISASTLELRITNNEPTDAFASVAVLRKPLLGVPTV
ncbi:MAG: hypothetical protein GXP31_07850 [Kiritimatiellaeota bacterium]|nr:hypothetical protein [Kiritimatiellota bacterium]